MTRAPIKKYRAKKILRCIENYIRKFGKPDVIYTHSWEGGHEDHDTCNLIVRKIKRSHQQSFLLRRSMIFVS
mgnify:CR=1 FL=1